MNSVEYVVNAKRTLSSQFHPDLVLPQFLHGVIGMVTEAGELLAAPQGDVVNQIEEIGDFTWYFGASADSIDMEIDDNPQPVIYETQGEAHQRLMVLSTELLDLIKKAFFYGKPLDYAAVKNFMIGINAVVQGIIVTTGTTRAEVYEANIKKLRARYPDKFTSEAAINRNLDEERKVLEEEVAA